MYTMEFQRKHESLDDVALSIAVEKTISKYASRLLSKDGKRGSHRDMQKGVLGLNIKRYEVNGHGVIEYREFIAPGRYISQVELQGFNEEEDIFKAIREEIKSLKEKDSQELKEIVMQK